MGRARKASLEMKSSSSSGNYSKDAQRFSLPPSSKPNPSPATIMEALTLEDIASVEMKSSICNSKRPKDVKRFSISPSLNPDSGTDTIMTSEKQETSVESSRDGNNNNNSKYAKRFSISPTSNPNSHTATTMAGTLTLTLTLEEETKTQTQMLNNIGKLSPDVLLDILSRLPIDSLFQCKQVCPSWRSVINHPDHRVPKMHYISSIQNQNDPTSLILFMESSSRIGTAMHPSLYYVHDIDNRGKAIKTNILSVKSSLRGLSIVGSCNGFLCLSEVLDVIQSDPISIVICNPVNGDWVKLPDSPFPDHRIHFGFGYNSTKKEYKVVRMRRDHPFEPLKVAVLTLGNNTWREIGTTTGSLAFGCYFGFHLNGVLHWFLVNDNNRSLVLSIKTFNLADETFGFLPVPACLKGQYYCYGLSHLSLGVLGGCLMLVDPLYGDSQQVWLMKDYKNKSWTLDFVIPEPPNCLERPEVRPLKMQKNGEILLECDEKFFSYDPTTATHELLTVPGIPHMFTAYPHLGTLVTLEDVITMEG